jgi:hypothetical protein
VTPAQITTRHGVLITTPARTIIDLAPRLRPRELEYTVDLADQRGLIDFADLRTANRVSLKALLSVYDPPRTRSEQERRFLALCDDHGIPQPETNSIVEGVEVDFVWRHASSSWRSTATATTARRAGSSQTARRTST